MAAPNYSEDLTDIDLAETTTGWSAYGGGGAGLSASPDLSMQGTNCVDKQITNADKGMYFDNSTGITLGTGDHIFLWHFCGTPGLTDLLQNKGASVLIGTSGTAYCQYHVDGNDTYGAAGRVARCHAIDYTIRTSNTGSIPYRTVTGTPGASPSVFGGGLVTTAAVKGANVGIDAIRYGTGAYLTAGELISAGDASDNPCTFNGFQVQNDAVANRWGILGLIAGSYELQGTFAIGQNNAGTPTLARFQDSDKNIVFINTPHSASDFTKIIIDHASTVCNLTNVNFTALGTNNPGQFVVNANNPTVNVTGGAWTDIGIATLRSNTTLNAVTIRRTDQVTQNGATISNCIFDQNTATSALLSNNPAAVTNCQFTSDGTGHAIEITTPGTYSFTGNTFSEYAGTDGTTGNEVIYNNSGGAVTLNVSNGDTPTIRNGAGASTTVVASTAVTLTGLVNGTEVTVYDTADDSEVDTIENVTGNQFTFSYDPGKTVNIFIHKPDYYRADILGYTIPGSNASVPVSQLFDPNYVNN